jgi:glucose-1-phosphate thymidylyltransferase
MIKKAICLAGGRATRLYPLTQFGISKQLLPIYNKPVISYSLGTLQKMGYSDVLIICADKEQLAMYYNYLGNGAKFGMNLHYKIQDKPNGLPEAFTIAGEWANDADRLALILGDNIFIGDQNLDTAPNTIFTYKVKNPNDYGVATLNAENELIDIIEKPQTFIGNDAVVGLYVFTREAVSIAKDLKPSKRGELEIVDLIKALNEKEGVDVCCLRDILWFDVGSFDSLLDCANLVRTIENRSDKKLGLQEI